MNHTLLQDLRQALRELGRSPGFTAAALLILVLAIGANTAVFSIADALLLRPLPLGEAGERIVTLHAVHPTQVTDWDDLGMSWSDIEDVRREARSLERVSAYLGRDFTLTGGDGEPERVRGGSITPGLLTLIGAEPERGRAFRAEDAAEPGFESVVILGQGLWQRRCGGDPQLVGRSIEVNQRALTVIGVMPAGFAFLERDELWTPYRPLRQPSRGSRFLLALARLTPEASLEQAREELAALSSHLAESHPGTNRDWSFHAIRFREFAVSRGARVLAVTLLTGVGLVLVVGCANLAGLLLVRGAGKRRELAVRTALGAPPGRLLRQMLAENLLLAAAGGALGALLAAWSVSALTASFPEPPPYWLRLAVDFRALAFTGAISLATGIGFGLVPALRASRVDVVSALADAGRGGAAGRRLVRLQGALVVAQVALSLALLVGAQLMVRSFLAMQSADPGFEQRPIATARLYLAGDAYDEPESKVAFFRWLVEELRALPSVAHAAASGSIPADDGGDGARVVAEDGAAEPGQELGAQAVVTTPGLFATLGLELDEGRDFLEGDSSPGGPPVVIVNRDLALQLWPLESALARRLGIVSPQGVDWHTVVGVAPPIHYEEFGEETAQSRRTLFVPYGRAPSRTMALLVRARGDAGSALGDVRVALRRIAPQLPAYDFRTMAQVRRSTTWAERVFGQMLAGFAAMALLLACVGVYGVMAYGAAQRVREVGIRLALGAERRDVLWLVLARGSTLAVSGIALGVPLTLATGRLLGGALYGVEPDEPAVSATIAIALVAAVTLAGYLPARRAAGVDPAAALRD